MRFFPCSSVEIDDDGDEGNQTLGKRSCYHSIRKFFIRNEKKKRVSISEPVPMTKDQAAQVQGLIEERSPHDHDSEEDSHVGQDDGTVKLAKIDAGTITEITNHNERENLQELLQQGWFWGDISRRDAEHLLRGQDEGTFLVRTSSDKRFLYSLSFRSNDKTLHTRIECANGLFYFYLNHSGASHDEDGSPSLIGLISDAMNQDSAENIFFYSRGLNKNETSLHTVTLVKPLSRFEHVVNYDYSDEEPKALQHLCKFIVHHSPCLAQRKLLDSRLSNQIKAFLSDVLLFPWNKTSP